LFFPSLPFIYILIPRTKLLSKRTTFSVPFAKNLAKLPILNGFTVGYFAGFLIFVIPTKNRRLFSHFSRSFRPFPFPPFFLLIYFLFYYGHFRFYAL